MADDVRMRRLGDAGRALHLEGEEEASGVTGAAGAIRIAHVLARLVHVSRVAQALGADRAEHKGDNRAAADIVRVCGRDGRIPRVDRIKLLVGKAEDHGAARLPTVEGHLHSTKIAAVKTRGTKAQQKGVERTCTSVSCGYGLVTAHWAPRSQSMLAEEEELWPAVLVMFGAVVQEKLVGMPAVPWPMRMNADSELVCRRATVARWPPPSAFVTRSAKPYALSMVAKPGHVAVTCRPARHVGTFTRIEK